MLVPYGVRGSVLRVYSDGDTVEFEFQRNPIRPRATNAARSTLVLLTFDQLLGFAKVLHKLSNKYSFAFRNALGKEKRFLFLADCRPVR